MKENILPHKLLKVTDQHQHALVSASIYEVELGMRSS